MEGFYFLFPTFLAVLVSFLIIRAASIALMMTGMSEQKAQFQALSAFSGTGFTSKESETIVNHPLRRKIVYWLMILGNAGVVTIIVTTTSSFATSHGSNIISNAFLLISGLYIIYRIATHKGLIRKWESYIEDKLIKSHVFEEGAQEDLLHLLEGYGLVRVIITKDSPFIDGSLLKLKLTQKGVLVLGIERGKHWLPIPKARETIKKGDRLIMYGPLACLKDLFKDAVKPTAPSATA